MQNIKDYGAIAGYVIGIAGFAYGFYKDYRLRAIEKRGKAPYFVVRHLEMDAEYKLDIISGKTSVVYPSQLRPLETFLARMSSSQEKVLDDYPDGRVMGIVLENKGAIIRSFSVKCKAEHLFQRYRVGDPREKSNYSPECYTLRYRFQRANLGKPLTFKIRFEVESGFRGSQVWQVKQGILQIQRLKPKSV